MMFNEKVAAGAVWFDDAASQSYVFALQTLREINRENINEQNEQRYERYKQTDWLVDGWMGGESNVVFSLRRAVTGKKQIRRARRVHRDAVIFIYNF